MIYVIIILGIIVSYLLYKVYNRQHSTVNKIEKHMEQYMSKLYEKPNESEQILDTPVSFGYKCMWLAVKTSDKDKIIEINNYKTIGNCNWETGVKKAYEGAIFITPSINQWTLVCGLGLTIDGGSLNEINQIKQNLIKLSLEFGEAQYFCTHRVVEYHCWIKAVNGTIIRAYSFLGEKGETIINEGEPTEVEQKYNLINTFSEESKEEGYFDREDIYFPDETTVMEIAKSWSINPCILEDNYEIKKELGILVR